MNLITREQAIARYGAIENGKWADEAKHCVLIEVHEDIQWINSVSGVRAGHIYCNKDMAEPLRRALWNVVDRGLAGELETFDGCLMVRDVRGAAGKLSWHCYALAIDFNARSNPLGHPATLSPELVKCFTDEGFIWGGGFHRVDGMHFQFAEG